MLTAYECEYSFVFTKKGIWKNRRTLNKEVLEVETYRKNIHVAYKLYNMLLLISKINIYCIDLYYRRLPLMRKIIIKMEEDASFKGK